MKVIGIDPAPSKETIIYSKDTGFISKQPTELKKYIDDLQGNDVLICWDAPLTAGELGSQDTKQSYSNFNWRHIEYVVNFKMGKQKPAKGISTMGYAGCSHWVITQYCLGLPSIYNPDGCRGAFTFVTDEPEGPKKANLSGPCIVEVHPALALWCLIYQQYKDKYKIWDYKHNLETMAESIEIIQKFAQNCGIKDFPIIDNKIKLNGVARAATDDHLDAYIAWLLGELWLSNCEAVKMVGNQKTGAILLPNTGWSQYLVQKLDTIILPLLVKTTFPFFIFNPEKVTLCNFFSPFGDAVKINIHRLLIV